MSAGRSGGTPSIDGDELAWVSMTPFGVPVVPEVKMRSKTSSAPARSQAATWASQSAGKPAPGSAQRSSAVVVGRRSRPTSRGSGASRPVPDGELPRLRPFGDPRIGVGRHPQVERDEDDAAPASPRSRRPASSGVGRRPGQEPIARLQAERPEPPGHEPAPPVELAVAPERAGSRRRAGGDSAGRSPNRATAPSRSSRSVSIVTAYPVVVTRVDGSRGRRAGGASVTCSAAAASRWRRSPFLPPVSAVHARQGRPRSPARDRMPPRAPIVSDRRATLCLGGRRWPSRR